MGKTNLAAVLKINYRYFILPHLVLACLTMALTTAFFGVQNLSELEAAAPMEMVLPFLGVILFTPVFFPEEDRRVADVVGVRPAGRMYIACVRLAVSVAVLALLLLFFTGFMKTMNCQVTPRLFFGVLGDSLFLGALGFFAAALGRNTPAAYLLPVAYYVMNYMMKDYLGKFYLFSMMAGDFSTTGWLTAGGTALLAAGLLVRSRTDR